MSKSDESFFLPTEDELYLIHTATSNDPEFALLNFNKWLKYYDFNVGLLNKNQILPHVYDSLEIGSKKLLPLVYSNFRKLHIDHPVANQFVSYYRYTSYRNHMLRNEFQTVIDNLQKQGIPYFVRKGMVYLSMFYGDYGSRPTSDVDIVIRKEHIESFLVAREKEGWQSVVDWHLNPIQDSIMHATTLRKNRFELDLHWRPTNHPIPTKWTEYIYNNLIISDKMWTIPKELHLVDTIVHGYGFNVVRPIRWMCDACKIIDSKISNWDLLIDYTNDCKLSLPVKRGLSYLNEQNIANVPVEILKRLDSLQIDRKMTKYFNKISTSDNNFYNVVKYALFISDSKWNAIIKVLKHYRLNWNQPNYFMLLLNMLLVFVEKIFFNKKVFLKKVRYVEH